MVAVRPHTFGGMLTVAETVFYTLSIHPSRLYNALTSYLAPLYNSETSSVHWMELFNTNS